MYCLGEQVKNVERIELGKYEMDTWYFSPLPAEYKDCKVSPCHHAHNNNNKYTFPVRRPGVHLNHLKITR